MNDWLKVTFGYEVRKTFSVTVWAPAVKLFVVVTDIKPVWETVSSVAVREFTPIDVESLI